MIRRAVAVLLTLALAIVALGSCTSGTDEAPARPLTSEEAQRLALTRFRNFDAGLRPVSFTVTDRGITYLVDAEVDFAAGAGYGLISDEEGTESLVLAWSASTVTTLPWSGTDVPRTAPEVDDTWTTSALMPQESRLHATLSIVLTMTADRPDNALLLQQTDARWLREDTVTVGADETAVSVFAGPTQDTVYDPDSGLPDDGSAATTRFWVDETGVGHRLELRLGGGTEWTSVDLGPGSDDDLLERLGGVADVLGVR
ncbi:hypothetical protein [Pseudactinotalea sp.]|uniref:hypothetical protein n=1 Tax=Pseudactinotalea sp. TaxID=1926260 RepID=UPI003B3AA299